tara:strand:- start:217 stop:867 length:651 start_codon:yes stop_codon:yes gene_type:complete
MGKDVDPKGNRIPREERLALAKKFVKAGCTHASYSLESGSDVILEAMNKRVKKKYFSEQVRICKEAGLITNTSLVLGYPQETKETIAESMTQLEELRVYPSTGYLLPLPETEMWRYAIDNGYIKDIDKYLIQITERQDFSLNLTKMSQEQLESETLSWLERLNKTFGNSLPKEKLIKTGGYDKHGQSQKKDRSRTVDRNKNTVETFNYATQEGTVR